MNGGFWGGQQNRALALEGKVKKKRLGDNKREISQSIGMYIIFATQALDYVAYC